MKIVGFFKCQTWLANGNAIQQLLKGVFKGLSTKLGTEKITMHTKDLRTPFPEHKDLRQSGNPQHHGCVGVSAAGYPILTSMAVPPPHPLHTQYAADLQCHRLSQLFPKDCHRQALRTLSDSCLSLKL